MAEHFINLNNLSIRYETSVSKFLLTLKEQKEIENLYGDGVYGSLCPCPGNPSRLCPCEGGTSYYDTHKVDFLNTKNEVFKNVRIEQLKSNESRTKTIFKHTFEFYALMDHTRNSSDDGAINFKIKRDEQDISVKIPL